MLHVAFRSQCACLCTVPLLIAVVIKRDWAMDINTLSNSFNFTLVCPCGSRTSQHDTWKICLGRMIVSGVPRPTPRVEYIRRWTSTEVKNGAHFYDRLPLVHRTKSL